MLFNGAHLGVGAEVEYGAVVHVNTVLPPGTAVPMGWFAGGEPVELVPPCDWERIQELMGPLDYAGTIFGVGERDSTSPMQEIAHRYARGLARHRQGVVVHPEHVQPTPAMPDVHL